MVINNQPVVPVDNHPQVKILARSDRDIIFRSGVTPSHFISLNGQPYELVAELDHVQRLAPEFEFAKAIGEKCYKASRLFEMITRNGPAHVEGEHFYTQRPGPSLGVPFSKGELKVWAIYDLHKDIETNQPILENGAFVYVFDRWSKEPPKQLV